MLSRFTRAFKEFSRKLISAEKVGVDGAGNQYYREPKFSDGLASERRWVVYSKDAELNSLPVEWRSWLSKTRNSAPTLEEVEAMEMQRKVVKLKASLLQKEEEKRQFRSKILNLDPDSVKVPSDLRQSGAALIGEVSPTSETKERRVLHSYESSKEKIEFWKPPTTPR